MICRVPQEKSILELADKLASSKRAVKQHLKDLQKLESNLFKISETNVKIAADIDDSADSSQIWKQVE